jgi:hypothetical protein
VLASIDDAAARLCRHDPLLDRARARTLAERGTRAVDGGVAWKHDPLHLTQGPYPFRLDAAASYWRAATAPVLYLDGDRSLLRLPDAELERRLGLFPAALSHAIELVAATDWALKGHPDPGLAGLATDGAGTGAAQKTLGRALGERVVLERLALALVSLGS